jgi:hypothetical protein
MALDQSAPIGAVGLASFGSAAVLPVIAAVFVLAAAILTWLSSPAERQAPVADDMVGRQARASRSPSSRGTAKK